MRHLEQSERSLTKVNITEILPFIDIEGACLDFFLLYMFIAIVSRGCRKLTQVNSEIPFNANNQDGKMSEGQMGESSKYFTPPAPLNNRGEDFSYIHLTTRFFGLRPLNDGKPMRNEQNGLVVMFSSAKHHKAQETKPDFNRNQIQNKLWQKQSNRNISTCVAQREVA